METLAPQAHITHPRRFWLLVGVSAVFVSGFTALLLLKPGTAEQFSTIDDVGLAAGWLLGAVICFLAGSLPRNDQGERTFPMGHKRIPFLLGLAMLAECIGQTIYTYNDLRGITPFPSLADAGYLSAIPLMIWAVLLLPTHHSAIRMRSRIVIDGTMVMIALLTFSWYFILGPDLLFRNEPLFARIIGSVYPFADLVLIFCVLLVSTRATDLTLGPGLRLMGIALVIITITDSIYNYMNTQGIYSYSWHDAGWPLGYLLLALSIHQLSYSQSWEKNHFMPSQQESAVNQPRSSLLVALAQALLIPLAIGIAVYLVSSHIEGPLSLGVYLGGGSLILLALFRQFLSIREIHFLNRDLLASNQELSRAQKALHEKNLKLQDANLLLEGLATTDPLTMLPNHRALVNHLDRELERARRYQRSCALLFLDIDHFKALNDGYGHPAGDAVLCEFATLVQDNLNKIDTFGRWGGEEFVAILPESTEEKAFKLARHIRQVVAEHSFQVGGGIRLTCSIGLASYPIDGHQRDSLLQAADQAMYGAKRLGRNQVRTPQDPAILALLAETNATSGRDEVELTGITNALLLLLETHDPLTSEHSRQVGRLVRLLALQMGFSETEAQMMLLSGQLHDIGKVVVPKEILVKPGKLTSDEYALMRAHPAIGSNVLNSIPALRPLATIIRAHHERWDGKGYPDQLSGEAIPIGSRMLAVVDAYMVMTTKRSYKRSFSSEQAFEELRRYAGTQFDAEVVEALIHLIEIGSSQESGATYTLEPV